MSEQLIYLRRAAENIRRQKAEIVLYVAQARILGDSWTQIGAALGMSKQGARQQFGLTSERAPVKGQTTLDEHLDD